MATGGGGGGGGGVWGHPLAYNLGVLAHMTAGGKQGGHGTKAGCSPCYNILLEPC